MTPRPACFIQPPNCLRGLPPSPSPLLATAKSKPALGYSCSPAAPPQGGLHAATEAHLQTQQNLESPIPANHATRLSRPHPQRPVVLCPLGMTSGMIWKAAPPAPPTQTLPCSLCVDSHFSGRLAPKPQWGWRQQVPCSPAGRAL